MATVDGQERDVAADAVELGGALDLCTIKAEAAQTHQMTGRRSQQKQPNGSSKKPLRGCAHRTQWDELLDEGEEMPDVVDSEGEIRIDEKPPKCFRKDDSDQDSLFSPAGNTNNKVAVLADAPRVDYSARGNITQDRS